MNLNEVLEMLQREAVKHKDAIQSLSDEKEAKESEIQEIDDLIVMLESFILKKKEERKILVNEYNELIEEIRRKKITGCMASGVDNFVTKRQEKEKAKELVRQSNIAVEEKQMMYDVIDDDQE